MSDFRSDAQKDYSDRMKDQNNTVTLPTAADVADDIMDNVHSEYDIFTWDTFDSFYQSELIACVISEIASFKAEKISNDHQLNLLINRSERLNLIEDCIKKHLIEAAKREGFPT